MRVLKFGGSCLATPESFSRAIGRVVCEARRGKTVVVLSAPGKPRKSEAPGCWISTRNRKLTDLLLDHWDDKEEVERLLIECAEYILSESKIGKGAGEIVRGLNFRRDELDYVSVGEELSARIAQIWLETLGIRTDIINPEEAISIIRKNGIPFPICDDKSFVVLRDKVISSLSRNDVAIVPGFFGGDRNTGKRVVLGRGGSDYTAVMCGIALDSDTVIYTDVDGVMRMEPELGKGETIPNLSFEQARVLTRYGKFGVIQDASILLLSVFGKNSNVRVIIANHFSDGPRTEIRKDGADRNQIVGVSAHGVSVFKFKAPGMERVPGVVGEISGAFASNRISIYSMNLPTDEIAVISEPASEEAVNDIETVFREAEHPFRVGFSSHEKKECVYVVCGKAEYAHRIASSIERYAEMCIVEDACSSIQAVCEEDRIKDIIENIKGWM